LMLGTLVENAIKHGIAPRASGGTVSIRALRDGDSLEVEVTDDGMGFRARSGRGVGLANIRARLETLFGGSGSLELAAGVAGGVIASIRLPLRFAQEPAPHDAPSNLARAHLEEMGLGHRDRHRHRHDDARAELPPELVLGDVAVPVLGAVVPPPQLRRARRDHVRRVLECRRSDTPPWRYALALVAAGARVPGHPRRAPGAVSFRAAGDPLGAGARAGDVIERGGEGDQAPEPGAAHDPGQVRLCLDRDLHLRAAAQVAPRRARVGRRRDRALAGAGESPRRALVAAHAQVDPAFVLQKIVDVERAYDIDPAPADILLDEFIAFLREAIPRLREEPA
jgi:hypothetical protein